MPRTFQIFRSSSLVRVLLTVVLFCAFSSLGTWQLQRLYEKNALIAQIEDNLGREPVPLWRSGSSLGVSDYARVEVTGRFDHDKEVHLYSVARENTQFGRLGFQVVTPMTATNGTSILVSRGWVPSKFKRASTRAEANIDGEQKVSGVLRTPRRLNPYLPDNDPAANVWYWLDMAAIEDRVDMALYPMVLEADATPNAGGWPIGGQTNFQVSNRHLEYVLTWYGMAIVVLIGAFFMRRMRLANLASKRPDR